MSFLVFFSGTISGKSRFLSTDDIKSALSKSYRLSVIEQSSDSIRCKIFIAKYWLGGFFGIPPFPKIHIKIKRGQDFSNMSYDFFWPEYLIAFVFSILIGIAVFSSTPDLLVVFTVFLFTMIILVCIIYLETKQHSIAIRMILENL